MDVGAEAADCESERDMGSESQRSIKTIAQSSSDFRYKHRHLRASYDGERKHDC